MSIRDGSYRILEAIKYLPKYQFCAVLRTDGTKTAFSCCHVSLHPLGKAMGPQAG